MSTKSLKSIPYDPEKGLPKNARVFVGQIEARFVCTLPGFGPNWIRVRLEGGQPVEVRTSEVTVPVTSYATL